MKIIHLWFLPFILSSLKVSEVISCLLTWLNMNDAFVLPERSIMVIQWEMLRMKSKQWDVCKWWSRNHAFNCCKDVQGGLNYTIPDGSREPVFGVHICHTHYLWTRMLYVCMSLPGASFPPEYIISESLHFLCRVQKEHELYPGYPEGQRTVLGWQHWKRWFPWWISSVSDSFISTVILQIRRNWFRLV